jgi:hypothetical protein
MMNAMKDAMQTWKNSFYLKVAFVLPQGFPHILQKVSFSIFMLLFIFMLKYGLIFMWFKIV